MTAQIYTGIEETCRGKTLELPRRAPNEYHFVIQTRDRETGGKDFRALCRWAREKEYYLCTLVAADERLKEDQSFKLYYVFSAPRDEQDNKPGNVLVILEVVLNDPQHPCEYPSIRDIYPSVIPLEKEIYDLFGLYPEEREFRPGGGFLLHGCFPGELYPLRRSRTQAALLKKIHEHGDTREEGPVPILPEGMLIVPVGPIHAGVIEPGHFAFHVAGEVIEDLPLRLGFKHRGLEKLFETDFELENGWELAERVSGDSSFAHSWAYCQAVENLAGVTLPNIVSYWRALFLELERIGNHIGDTAALVHDMAYDRKATPLFELREAVMRLNGRLTGHRLLRNVNRPGGLDPGLKPDLEDIQRTINAVKKLFEGYSREVMNLPSCRDRVIGTGILTYEEARNATGLVRRASSWKGHESRSRDQETIKQELEWEKYDFRLRHPQGIYAEPAVQRILKATIIKESDDTREVVHGLDREFPIYEYYLQGDVFARMAMRAAEVETSARLIEHIILKLRQEGPIPPLKSLTQALKQTPNLEFGLGYVEGWRGDIFYWVMKGPGNTIFRCQPRDPSIFDWYVFPAAVERKEKAGEKDSEPKEKPGKSKEYWENILADFPLINKSFNLSYAGHDR